VSSYRTSTCASRDLAGENQIHCLCAPPREKKRPIQPTLHLAGLCVAHAHAPQSQPRWRRAIGTQRLRIKKTTGNQGVAWPPPIRPPFRAGRSARSQTITRAPRYQSPPARNCPALITAKKSCFENYAPPRTISLEATAALPHSFARQGPWTADLRTPPGPEGSNGSLLYICRGHPGISFNSKLKMQNYKRPAPRDNFAFLIFNY